MKKQTKLFTLTLLLGISQTVLADGEIRFSNNAYKQVIKEDAAGNTSYDYVDPGLVIPGDVIYYEIGVENISDKPAENIVIDNPLPNNTKYREGSANGENTTITFSVDGRTFKPADQLTVTDASGNVTRAKAEDYSHIRWVFDVPLQPGEKSVVTYKTTIRKADE
jgi:uncharacterized repeat protein (TIGR01451 family)